MSKEQLIETLQKKAELESKTQSKLVVDTILEEIENELRKGESVTLRSFGTFSVEKRGARKGRNPQTGEEISIPAKKVVKFSPGKELQETAKAIHFGKGMKWLKEKQFVRDMDYRLKDMKKKFDSYVTKADRLGDDARKVYKESSERIKPVYDDAKNKLQSLKKSSGGAWDEMKKGFDKAFEELKNSFQKARKKF